MISLGLAPKIARLLPRLASEHDGEVIATARAIGRTLKSAGSDFHDLARQIERQPETALPPPRRERRERAPTTAGERQSVDVLRRALSLDVLNEWEIEFAQSILSAAQRRDWRPTRRQAGVIDRLVRKAKEAEAFDL